MTPSPQETRYPRPPVFASPARQVLHLLVSAAGWVLFFYWWGIVLRGVSRRTVEVTGLFLLISFVVVVGLTILWAWHSRRLYEKKGPRTKVREAAEDYSRDALGRTVRFEGAREALQSAPEVEVDFDDSAKTYRSSADGQGQALAQNARVGA